MSARPQQSVSPSSSHPIPLCLPRLAIRSNARMQRVAGDLCDRSGPRRGAQLKPKHATKQVDRLLSNAAINVDDILVRWVPFVVGARSSAVIQPCASALPIQSPAGTKAMHWAPQIADRALTDLAILAVTLAQQDGSPIRTLIQP
jgi:hypothetical protein